MTDVGELMAAGEDKELIGEDKVKILELDEEVVALTRSS